MPTDNYREAREQEASGGIERDIVTLPVDHQSEQKVGYPQMPLVQSPIDPPAGERTLGVARSINVNQEIKPRCHPDLIEARIAFGRMSRREEGT